MRVVSLGRFERVKICCLIIRREDDLLEIVQQWMDPVEGDQGQVRRQREHVISAEDVMWCGPTVFDLEDVTQWEGPGITKPGLKPGDSFEWWITQKAVASSEGITETEMAQCIDNPNPGNGKGQGPTGNQHVNRRHLVILVMYEISDESDPVICQRANYKSPMPMVSARAKVRQNPEFQARLKRAVGGAVACGAVVQGNRTHSFCG
jgi:hypothetical protein